ncbi:uncharacterized protein LOC124812522 [Hydra vulgaris]|uniref:uncharacterized protein LOC124812522 n=1 Tax=Hydra vulgaris TaxID=6087 RepID=UPI001F5ECB49|nr:uncharacterized protein LOC124812522 [Hydra vulgaris]
MKNTQSIILINGFISAPFKVSRGVRQGDPFSLMLYCIAVETLALEINKNTGIDGVPIPGSMKPLKVMQYADNTTIFVRNPSSIDVLFEILTNFEKATGSNINKEKTKALALGGFNFLAYEKYVQQGYYQNHKLSWTKSTGLKILGVTFFTDLGYTASF